MTPTARRSRIQNADLPAAAPASVATSEHVADVGHGTASPGTVAVAGRAAVVVIGGGQAGLSAAHHLARRGFVDARAGVDPERGFVVLDAEERAGGAWLHRWESLSMATVNGIFDLPGLPREPADAGASARKAIPDYFAAYEKAMSLPILRPVSVTSVSPADEDPRGDLVVETRRGRWVARVVVNATGTWTNPTLPRYPGHDSFRGRMLHTRDYRSLSDFAGERVAVVGGGISAVQQLEEISRVAEVFWYTRREPVFRDGGFSPEVEGREVIARVTADVEAGSRTGSVVSYTGLGWAPYAIAARDRGALDRRPMFTAIEPDGVREASGALTRVDTILWATGFRAALGHLDPLHLQNDRGGIRMRGTQVADEPRVHLIGFGPSQSTIGANRAGRAAVRDLERFLDAA